MDEKTESGWGSMNEIDALKEYLKAQSFAVLCVGMDVGHGIEAVVIVKSSRDLLDGLRAAQARPELAWLVDRTEAGPILCLVTRTHAETVGSLAGETYFDPTSDLDRDLLKRLTEQTAVRMVYLDEDAEVVWLAEVAWDEIRRLEAEQVLDRAEQILDRTKGYDFARAKELFQDSVTLDDLLDRAFPQL